MSEFSSQPSGLLKVLPMKELEIGGRKEQLEGFFFLKKHKEDVRDSSFASKKSLKQGIESLACCKL